MGKIAFVFPGQGSQSVGMGASICAEEEAAGRLFAAASEILGWDLGELCFNGPAEKLNLTQFAQPALYVTSLALAAVLAEKGASADAVAGHSLGDYSALGASGAVTFEQGLKLVARRGSLMAEASETSNGSMAAVLGLEDELVEEICSDSGDVWAVNYNSPGQVVISGAAGAVAQAVEAARAAGAKKVVELAVSGPFHTGLMQPAAESLQKMLEETVFRSPRPPFFSATDCDFVAAAALPEMLARQMTSPVRWRQSVERLIAGGTDLFIEIGSGKVLCGLVRRISRDVETLAVSDGSGIEKALRAMENARG